ncbi:hypothetical protein [Haloglomus litoreum]|uniref:hypothetical protein n=1 Tax=Haloglomus litoreum TaxID=3034026 RepID=UPI0023E85EE2|nr:hypothetical protein [Haloglomus sp. DT116]
MTSETGSGGVVDRTGTQGLPPALADRLPRGLRSDEQYRAVLLTLVEFDGACSLSSLTRALVEERGWPRDPGTSGDPYRATHLALVRQYVPVLATFDALDYDDELGRVSLPGVASTSGGAEGGEV